MTANAYLSDNIRQADKTGPRWPNWHGKTTSIDRWELEFCVAFELISRIIVCFNAENDRNKKK